MNNEEIEQIEQIEQEIADLKRRWPAHSVPPRLWDELEELESRLEEARALKPPDGEARDAG